MQVIEQARAQNHLILLEEWDSQHDLRLLARVICPTDALKIY